jgi:hypothetical protein
LGEGARIHQEQGHVEAIIGGVALDFFDFPSSDLPSFESISKFELDQNISLFSQS